MPSYKIFCLFVNKMKFLGLIVFVISFGVQLVVDITSPYVNETLNQENYSFRVKHKYISQINILDNNYDSNDVQTVHHLISPNNFSLHFITGLSNPKIFGENVIGTVKTKRGISTSLPSYLINRNLRI